MFLRQATRHDLSQVLPVLKELNKGHVDYFNKNRVKWLLKNMCVCVAMGENGDTLGVCVVEDNYDDTFEIFAIAVNPMYQKHFGVGSKLLKWAESMAVACDREIIYARSYKIYNASPFYTKNGYNVQSYDFGYTFFKYL